APLVWKTAGGTCQGDQWRKFRHDEWNTGTYGKDTRRPARITDLRAAGGAGSVTLGWTAVGDDGRCGTATSYDLRASATPITRTNFTSATPVGIAPPGPPGSAASRTSTPPAAAPSSAHRAIHH